MGIPFVTSMESQLALYTNVFHRANRLVKER